MTWVEGDPVAIWKVGDPRSTYKKFVLYSGAGQQAAYFKGATDNDYIVEGGTYKAVYPYSAVVNYNAVTTHTLTSAISASNSTTYLADDCWLASDNVTIPVGGETPKIVVHQQMALIKLSLAISNFNSDSYYAKKFANINFTIVDASTVFANDAYFGDTFTVENVHWSAVASARFSQVIPIVNAQTYVFWIPIIQSKGTGNKPLTLSVHWKNNEDVEYHSAITNYTPQGVFTAGKIYTISLGLQFTSNDNNTASLSRLQQ